MGDVGGAVKAVGDGDVTGVKNAKREEEGLVGDIGAAGNAFGNGDVTGVKNAKRQLVGDVGAAGKAFGDGVVTDVKNAKREDGLVSDIGAAGNAFGDGDVTGVKNAKRDIDLETAEKLIDASDVTESQKTAAKKIIGDTGLAVMNLGKGDISGVKNAEGKRTDSLLGNINLPMEIFSNGELIGTKRSVEEDANAEDLVDLGLLTDGLLQPLRQLLRWWCHQRQARRGQRCWPR